MREGTNFEQPRPVGCLTVNLRVSCTEKSEEVIILNMKRNVNRYHIGLKIREGRNVSLGPDLYRNNGQVSLQPILKNTRTAKGSRDMNRRVRDTYAEC